MTCLCSMSVFLHMFLFVCMQHSTENPLLKYYYYNYAPINVMPDYHKYGLRWGQMGICILENYNSPPTGEAQGYNPPHNPDKSPSSKTWD